MNKVLFQVSLSNGDTLFEGKGVLQVKDGEPSAWQKLIKYRAEKKVRITSMSLYTQDGRTFNLPSAGKQPKFQAFDMVEQPYDYVLERKIGTDRGEVVGGKIKLYDKPQNSNHFTCAIAFYKNHRLELWVDEDNPKNCWVLARPHEI